MDGIITEYTYNGLGNRILVTTKNGSKETSKKEYVYDVTSTYQDIIEVVDTKEVENKRNSALLTLIAKASADALADYLIQTTMNYFFNPTTQFNLKKSFTQVNKWQIARSALEGFIPWKSTKHKFAKAALAAAGDVLTNALYIGSNYTERQAVMDFGTGFISDLAGGEISELVSKYGAKYVANGLKKLNMSDSFIKKVTGIDLNAKKTPVSTYAGYKNPASSSNKGVGKSVPNPSGKKGGLAHQQEIKNIQQDIKSKDLKPVTEYKYNTPGGTKSTRYADVVAVDKKGKVVEVHQVGKVNKNGTPVSREVKAINDIKGAKNYNGAPITYHSYNKY